MEVFNYLFRSFRDLEEFIKENIPKDKEILLQIFSGYISEDFTKELIKVLKNYFGNDIIRVHDAIYVKHNRKQVKSILNKIPFFCGITKLNNYSKFLNSIFCFCLR